MADLRQRRSNLANGVKKSDIPKETFVEPKSSSFLSNKTRIFMVSVAISCAVFFFYRKQQILLPESYALCSRSGQNIYTVDHFNSRVQCVVVHRSEIVDTGSLGEPRNGVSNVA